VRLIKMAKPFVRLRAKFLEEDVDQKSLARLINIDPSTLSKKTNGI
jgi:plasmid maintenance system antidote protein VapI